MAPMTPQNLHRGAAALEMLTWTLLIGAMILRGVGGADLVSAAGPIHGFGFLCFVALTIILWTNNRWPAGVGIAGLAVSLIPFAALPFSIWADRRGHLDGDWRFRDRAEEPRSLPDKVLAQLVRRPVRTVLIILVLIAVVFTALLLIGQPYDPEAIPGN